MSAITPLLVLFGLAVGTIGTMMGVGGGFLHVPFLTLVFGFSPQAAMADSLAIIFLNTLAGSCLYYEQKRIDLALAGKLSFAVVPGAVLGPLIADGYSSDVFALLFCAGLLLCALKLVIGERYLALPSGAAPGRSAPFPETSSQAAPGGVDVELGVLGTFIIGFLSNLMGIGGGIIHVPFLILLLRVPTHVAIGTSHFILCVSSGLGTLVFVLLGHVHLDFAIPIGIGATLGAAFGANLARRAKALVLRRMLAALLALVALKMAVSAW
ncbi:MAG: sulfite exporter TauE/SafE family protein [Deltaproteobacteria bacterium]|nr:sulfite exporter TauE/SafE family protein [Deltaproteobacteria bacterium]